MEVAELIGGAGKRTPRIRAVLWNSVSSTFFKDILLFVTFKSTFIHFPSTSIDFHQLPSTSTFLAVDCPTQVHVNDEQIQKTHQGNLPPSWLTNRRTQFRVEMGDGAVRGIPEAILYQMFQKQIDIGLCGSGIFDHKRFAFAQYKTKVQF